MALSELHRQPPSGVHYRPLHSSEVGQFEGLGCELFTATFGHLYRTEDLQSYLGQVYSPTAVAADLAEGKHIWVAQHAQRWIGYCKMGQLGLPVQPRPEHALELKQLYVHGDYHSTGVADGFMQIFFRWARDQQCSQLYISCWSENQRALAFYRKYGFEPVGAYKFWVGTHADEEWILKHSSATNQSCLTRQP